MPAYQITTRAQDFADAKIEAIILALENDKDPEKIQFGNVLDGLKRVNPKRKKTVNKAIEYGMFEMLPTDWVSVADNKTIIEFCAKSIARRKIKFGMSIWQHYYMDGLTLHETAKQLNIGYATVNRKIKHIQSILKSEIEELCARMPNKGTSIAQTAEIGFKFVSKKLEKHNLRIERKLSKLNEVKSIDKSSFIPAADLKGTCKNAADAAWFEKKFRCIND